MAYATGVTTIKTAGNLLKFDISAKTGKNTRVFIPLNTGMSVSENKFVTFMPPVNDEKRMTRFQRKTKSPLQL